MKKLLLKLLVSCLLICSALCVFTACSVDNKADNDTNILAVYNLYVANAQSNGETPLTYEQWLATIKGEQGPQGEQGLQGPQGETGATIEKIEYDQQGRLVITLTDGTVLDPVETPVKSEQPVNYTEGLHYQKIAYKEEYAVLGLGTASDTDVVIPATYKGLPVTKISEYAFSAEKNSACKGINSVIIPNSVTSIGKYAFRGCESLIIFCEATSQPDGWDVYWQDSDMVIWGCKINDVDIATIDGIVYSLKDGTATFIRQLRNITTANIPSIVTYKGQTYSVTSIGDYAFYCCYSLTSIVIPNSVTSIGDDAFSGCSSLTYNVKDGLEYLGNTTNKYLYLAGTENYFIASATIDANCKFIGEDSFSGCYLLTSITIPSSVTSIGNSAFHYCSSLTSITIPNSVTNIGDYAFYDCHKLVEVYNKSTLDITKGEESYGFIGYYALDVYTQESNSKLSTDSNGYIIYTDGTEKILVGYLGNETELTLPNGITTINKYAFAYCRSLTSITIPSSVTSIGKRAFAGCTGLTSIAIPNSVTNIGDYAFMDCHNSLKIYCEATSQPDGWGEYWNFYYWDDYISAEWGYNGQNA